MMNQNWNCGLASTRSAHQLSSDIVSCPSSSPLVYWLYACCSRRQRLLAMIWWTRQVRVTWAAFRKESAVPVVATPASTRAPVHPIASRRDFSAAISIWSPPKRIVIFSMCFGPSPLDLFGECVLWLIDRDDRDLTRIHNIHGRLDHTDCPKLFQPSGAQTN